jgi:hypothetical protein
MDNIKKSIIVLVYHHHKLLDLWGNLPQRQLLRKRHPISTRSWYLAAHWLAHQRRPAYKNVLLQHTSISHGYTRNGATTELHLLAATNFARDRQQTAAAVAELVESTCPSPGYQGAAASPPRLAAPTSSDRECPPYSGRAILRAPGQDRRIKQRG